ncbi:hypothetical protein BD408DRAFT_326733, partial [Parasitella parasitica]
LQPFQWKWVWKIPMPLSARTVWYRSIHGKIPSRSLLHRLMPQTHTSSHCTLCLDPAVEDLQHLFFLCPQKIEIWSAIVLPHISSIHISNTDLHQHLLSLLHLSPSYSVDRVESLPHSRLSMICQIFAITLLTIWQAHWRWIFDRAPLLSSTVIRSITRSLNRL